MLTLENITKTYFDGSNQRKVLDNINFSFPQFGFIGIKGESGSGKSTLLNVLSSLEKADNGSIFFFDKKIEEDFLRKEIAFISQNDDLISSLTIKENILIGTKIAETAYSFNEFKRIVKMLEIDSLLSYYPYQLSGGQKRRVSIARALLKEASILLADEPTGALHEKQAKEVMSLLKEQSKKRLVIIVSHDNQLLQEFCDSLLTLENGKILGEVIIGREMRIERGESKKYSLLFYVHSRIKNQKYTLSFLLLFQIIIIISLTIMITAMNGIEATLNNTYHHSPKKTMITIEKFDNTPFEQLPLIEDAQCYYESILSLGELEEDIEMAYLPLDKNHIKLKAGRLPENKNEILVTSSLKNKINTYMTYKYNNQNILLKVVGVLEDDFFKERIVYFVHSFSQYIEDYINKQVVVVESQNAESLYQSLSDEYIVFNDAIEGKNSYMTLLELGRVISMIFFGISFMCSFFLFYIVYQTIGEKRKSDSAILLMLGLYNKQLFSLFMIEALYIGLLMGVLGSLGSYLSYYYINEVFHISSYFAFSLVLKTYFLTCYDIYLLIIVLYILLSVISAYLPAKKIVNSHLVSMLREE